MKRLFVAIKIVPDENFLKSYHALRYALQLEKISWVKPDNFHLTLKFLGKTPEEKLPVIRTALQQAAAQTPCFSMKMAGTGIFGSSYKPRVLWFGVENDETIHQLGEMVLNSLDKAGFPRDRQNFIPHLTIGRINKIEHKKMFQEAIAAHRDDFLQEFPVDKIILYESLLKPSGVIYRVIMDFPLG
ncbi:MAG TPA: RNA 2',3'-cyclic phosphodiesterase [Bacteroidetes bacterium]|nr:RNA 2',3'-cyclic phosphodiesterase [Bacteroidota bacterium]